MSINTNNSRQGAVKVYRMINQSKQSDMDSLTRDYAASKSNLVWAAMAALKAWDTCPTGEWKDKWMMKYAEAKAKAYSTSKPVFAKAILPVEEHNIACKALHLISEMKESIERGAENDYWLPVRFNMGALAKKYALMMAQNMAYSRESIQERLDIELNILKTMKDTEFGQYVSDSIQRYTQAFSSSADKCQCHKVSNDKEMVQAFAEIGLIIQDTDNMNDGANKVEFAHQKYEGGC